MALIQNTGQTSGGLIVPIPVGGLVASTSTPLAANKTYFTDILPYKGNESVHFTMFSDQIGTYVVEYYKGTTKLAITPGSVMFDPAASPIFQGALAAKGDGFRIVYTNGSVAQTSFYFEVRFGDSAQQTYRSFGTPAANTNMAGTTHAAIEGRNNGAGAYGQVTATPNAAKIAMDVNVVNPTGTTDVSALTNGSQRTILVDGNNAIRGTVGSPLGVQVTNFPSNTNILPATSGTFTAITLAANVQQTIAANANRKQIIIYSPGVTILVGVGFNATASNYTYKIIKDGVLEIDELTATLSVSLFAAGAATVNVTQII